MDKVLIVIDMQNDFITGSLGTPEARAVLGSVREKIRRRKSEGYRIIFTKDTHGENYLESSEGRHLPVKHCIRGTYGWEISDELDTEGAQIICKPSFGYTGWELEGAEEIELAGVCTDICVISNALIIKALYPEANVTVDSSCCAGVTPQKHDAALDVMRSCQINVL